MSSIPPTSESGDKASNWFLIASDSEFQHQINSANDTRLVVCYFYSPTCPHCTKMTPIVQRMAVTYERALFLQIDVNRCSATIRVHKVRYTPTFLLVRHKEIVGRVDGGEPSELEGKLRRVYTDDAAPSAGPGKRRAPRDGADPHNLRRYINTPHCDCANYSGDVPLFDLLFTEGNVTDHYLESDVNSWIVVFVPFTRPVRLHSLVVRGPPDYGPKTVRLFVNQPHRIKHDFDDEDPRMRDDETLVLSPDDLVGDRPEVKLKAVERFVRVTSLTLLLQDNQLDDGPVRVFYTGFIGCPLAASAAEGGK